MSYIKNQIYFDYNGDYEDFENGQALEHYDALGIAFDLFDDDTFWLENTAKEKKV